MGELEKDFRYTTAFFYFFFIMTIPKHALHLATLAVLLSLCVETNSKNPLGLLKNRETRSELDHWGRVERLKRHGGNDGRIMASRQDDDPSAATAQTHDATAQQDNADKTDKEIAEEMQALINEWVRRYGLEGLKYMVPDTWYLGI